MKELSGMRRAMAMYSFLVVTLLFILGTYLEISLSNNRHIDTRSLGSRVPRDMPYHATRRPCEVVHVAFIAEDVTSTINLVKSILIYRHSALHLHLIAHPFTKEILEHLLTTWSLPYFNVSFYSFQSLKDEISWIPDLRQKDVYGLIKLQLPDILPSFVHRLIIIDNNVTFQADIRELFKFFWDMEDDFNFLASVDPHITVNPIVTSKINDTSVLLMDVSAMKKANWFHLWHKVIFDGVTKAKKKYTFNLESILNSITESYPNSHVAIPCYWNVFYQHRNKCLSNTTSPKLIHWDFTTPEEEQEREKIMKQLLLYDGKVLAQKPWICQQSTYHPRRWSHNHHAQTNHISGLPKRSRREMCRILKKDSEQVFRTHRYYHGIVYTPKDDFETTLVTQLSLDRLEKFLLLLQHWDGPVSIAMYGTDAQAWNLTRFMYVNGLIDRKNLAIHIVYRQGKFYPVNHLRNLALNAVTTPYVFLNDGDFLPSYGLFDYLKIANRNLMNNNSRRALVIPAFDGQPGFAYPESKSDLLDQLNNNTIRVFCVWCSHQTHGQTNFSLWTESMYPYKVEWAYHFEPYVVVRSDVVRYDERFIGYGWNKVSQITELKAQGYEFVVVPDGFVVHSPHKHSNDREVWKRKNFKFCINTIWKRFVQDLFTKYGNDCLREIKAPPRIIKTQLM